MAAKKKEIPTLTSADIEIDTTRCGLKGSPTKVKKTYTPVREKVCVKIEEEDTKTAVLKLADLLTDSKVI